MAKTSVPPRKAKPSPSVPPATAVKQRSGDLLLQAALLLDAGAMGILASQEDGVHAIVRAARRNIEQHIQEHDDCDDDRSYQALGILVLLDRALDAEVDLEQTSLVDPLRNAMEAAHTLLESSAGDAKGAT